MAIIKYYDGQNLVALGATGDHGHDPEAIGAAKKVHGHDVVDADNDKAGFMSVADKNTLDALNKEIFDDTTGLSTLVGTESVQAQISDALKEYVKTEKNFTADYETKLQNIAVGAEVNQDAFSKITVKNGETSVDITADTKTDQFTFTAGDNVILTPNTNDGGVTIAAQDTTYSEASGESAGLMSADDKNKLDGIAGGATNVIVDESFSTTSTNAIQNKTVATAVSTLQNLHNSSNGTPQTVAAEIASALGSLKYAKSSTTNGTATSAEALTSTSQGSATQPVYFDSNGKPAACTYSLNKTVPSDAQFTDTTYSEATTSTAGLMSKDDKTKLNGIATNANNYSLPTASSTQLGGVKVGGGLSISSETLSVNRDDSLSTTSTNAVQNKTVTSAINDIKNLHNSSNGTPQTVAAEIASALGSLKYAQSSAVNGAATSAEALTTKSQGSATQPVYFDANGKPAACSYTLGKSVPSNAVFTDTTYSNATTSTAGLMSKDDKNKLNGIASGANNYSLPIASTTTLGGVKVGGGLSISSETLSVNRDDSLSTTSTNAVQNKTVTSAINDIKNLHNSSNGTPQTVAAEIASALGSLKYAQSSAVNGAATSANKVNQSLTVKLNNGTTANTNYFTFDGSSAKTINITPSNIGAATSGHNHDNTYAPKTHSHSEYASSSHSHTASEVGAASSSHTHDGRYYTETEIDNKLSGYSTTSHGHNGYASSSHSHTASEVGAASSSHTHDDRYYTETEINTKLSGYSTTSHGHTNYASSGHTHDTYMTTSNPEASGKLSINKKTGYYSGVNSICVGTESIVGGDYSYAEGYGTHSTATCSHAEGYSTQANGDYSHAEGYGTNANGNYSYAGGYCTTADANQFAIGHCNKVGASAQNSGTTGDAFIIGNGYANSKSNAFRISYNSDAYLNGSTIAAGADYAEYFEWQDLNPDKEDRRGHFVTLDGEKIKIAKSNDYILGIVSGQPAVIGNGDEDWRGRYILDEFGAYIPEEFEYEEEIHETVIDEETGEARVETKTVTKTGTKYKENPDYDPSLPYVQRADRPEWDAVGMMGVLSVRDDGTCQVNGYCKVAEGGIATASESGYRVIKRINDHIVKVVFR